MSKNDYSNMSEITSAVPELIDSESLSAVQNLLESYVVNRVVGEDHENLTDLKNSISSSIYKLSKDTGDNLKSAKRDIRQLNSSFDDIYDNIHDDIEEASGSINNELRNKVTTKQLSDGVNNINSNVSTASEKIKSIIEKTATKDGLSQMDLKFSKMAGEIEKKLDKKASESVFKDLNGNIIKASESIKKAIDKSATKEDISTAVSKISGEVTQSSEKVIELAGKLATDGHLSQTDKKIDKVAESVNNYAGLSREILQKTADIKNSLNITTKDLNKELNDRSKELSGKIDTLISDNANEHSEIKTYIDSFQIQKKLAIASLSVGALNFIGIVAMILLSFLN